MDMLDTNKIIWKLDRIVLLQQQQLDIFIKITAQLEALNKQMEILNLKR